MHYKQFITSDGIKDKFHFHFQSWNHIESGKPCKTVFALQENETSQADKYAELAMAADRYNPAGVEKSQLFLTFRYLW